MKKEELLSKLRKNTHIQYDMPAINIEGIRYDDTLEQFVKMTETVGGHVVKLGETDTLASAIHAAYPDARIFASNLNEVDAAALQQAVGSDIELRNPDTVSEANDLNGVDVGIVRGEVGVAENGCIWIPQTMKEKALLFISEYLVIVLDRQQVVDNMHDAYARIQMDPAYNFGTFISGPSKTADIEQALVMGAQAARGVTVVLL